MNILNLSSTDYDDRKRNQAIIQAFDQLNMGDRFIVTSDNNLNSLYNHLEEQRMSVVEWENLKEGPEEWEAVVSKKFYNFI